MHGQLLTESIRFKVTLEVKMTRAWVKSFKVSAYGTDKVDAKSWDGK
jgi:hypothetical protein